MSIKNSKTFCPVPWLHLSVDSDQSLRLCCHGVGDRSLKDDKGQLVYLNEIAERGDILNINQLKDIRKSFVDGGYPKTCEDCFLIEASGGRSPRHDFLNKHKGLITSLEENTSDDGSVLSSDYRFLDISIGNKCNLKCRMCSPPYSKAIAKDWEELGLEFDRLAVENGSWSIDESLTKSLESIGSHIEFIEIQGGEPQIGDETYKVLDVFVQLGLAKNINVKVFTNLTKVDIKLANLLMNFKAVSMMVSIEGINKVNDYIRYPSKFDEINSNLESLKKMAKAFPMYITFNCVFQSYNALFVVDLIKHLRPYMPCFSFLHYPDPFSAQHLPDDIKDLASKRIEEFMIDFKPESAQDEIGLGTLKTCLERMKNSKRDISSFEKFKEYTNKLDKVRGQSLFDIIPEFKNHWGSQ